MAIVLVSLVSVLGSAGTASGGDSIRPTAWTISTDFDVTLVVFLDGGCPWAAATAPDGTVHYASVDAGSLYHWREGDAAPELVSGPTVACEVPDLAFRADGSAVVAWIDTRAESPSVQDWDLYVASQNDGWREVLVTGGTTLRVMRARIEVDALGEVHAAYIRMTNPVPPYNEALFAATSPTWQETRVSDDTVRWYALDLAVDSWRQGHAVWISATGDEVRYANESSGWADVVVRTAGGNPYSWADDAAVAVDATDRVHLAWADSRRTSPLGTPFFSEIWYASPSGGFVNSEIALPDEAAPIDRKWSPEFGFDAAGTIHLAFLVETADYVRNLYYSNSTDWSRGVRLTNRTAADPAFTELSPHPFSFRGGAPVVLFSDGRAGIAGLWRTGPWDYAPDTSPPRVALLPDRFADVGVGLELSATGTWDEDRIASYEWHLGATVLTIPVPWFVPSTAGTFPSRLIVRDPAGHQASSSFVLTVRPAGARFWSPPRDVYTVPGARGYLEIHPWTGTAFPLTWLGWGSYLSYPDLAGRTTVPRVSLYQGSPQTTATWDPAGNLHIVGAQQNGARISYEKRSGSGALLVGPVDLPVGGQYIQPPTVAFAGDRLWTAWSDGRTGDYEVYLAGLDLVGTVVWGPTQLSNTTGTSSGAVLVPSGDRLWAVWGDSRSAGTSMVGSALNLTSLAFEVQEARLGAGYTMDAAPLPGSGVAVTSGVPTPETRTYELFLHRLDAQGNASASAVRVSLDDGIPARGSSLDTDAQGNAYVAWWETRNGTWIRYARVPVAGPPEPEGGAVLNGTAGWADFEQVSVRLGPDGEPRVAFTVGTTDAATLRFTYRDPVPPTARIDGPTTARAGQPLTFSASASSDNVEIAGYRWSLGDGTNRTGPTVDHTFLEGGVRAVRLTVADGAGNTDTVELQVTVADEPPVARISGPATVDEDAIVTFSGSGSTDDAGIDRYQWTVTGPATVTSEGRTLTLAFPDPGTYTVRLTVTDAGNQTDSAEVTVVVRDVVEPWKVTTGVWIGIAAAEGVTVALLVREWRRRGSRKSSGPG